MKRNKDSPTDLWDNIKHTNIQIIGLQKKKRERVWENIWRYYSQKIPQMGKESQPNPRSTESPIKDKHKENHAKTHINQTNKSKVQRKKY